MIPLEEALSSAEVAVTRLAKASSLLWAWWTFFSAVLTLDFTFRLANRRFLSDLTRFAVEACVGIISSR